MAHLVLSGSASRSLYTGLPPSTTGKPDLNPIPRRGGPKETRLNRVKLMETGRYFESCIARGETFGDIDNMRTLRINNLFHTSEERIRKEFIDTVGHVGDVYRPYNKDRQQPQPFVFVRFETRSEMLEAMNILQGKIIDGRKMEIVEAKAAFELETSVY
jgi:RNA recognition motif-containing protein